MESTHTQFLKAYDKYADAIFRHCYFRVGNKEDAEELTQEVFIKSWKFLADGGVVKSVQAFLYRVARNCIIDFMRKKRDATSLDVLRDSGFEPTKDDTEHLNNMLDSKSALLKLAQLETVYKEILLLRYVDGLQPKEIATILQLTPNVVSVRLHRAKKHMKNLIQI